MPRITIYRWATQRGIVPQVAYNWRKSGLPVDADNRVDPDEADDWLSRRHRPQRGREAGESVRSRRINEAIPLPSLAAREEESIVKGLCSLGFLRAQARTLASRSQEVFVDLVWIEVYPALPRIRDRGEFDRMHDGWVRRLQSALKTSSEGQLSYGQGQKSLNVALKFVVDWASRPDAQNANRLRPWLHCPLDRVVMEYLSKQFPDQYQTRIAPLYPRTYGQQRFSLTRMNADAYHAWQAWIRELLPSKPVILDVVWVFERPGFSAS